MWWWGGQIPYLLSIAHIDSLSIPYVNLLFWHLWLLISYHWSTSSGHSVTILLLPNSHSVKTVWDLFFLSLYMHPYISDSVMLGTWNNWFFVVLVCWIKVNRPHGYKTNLLEVGCFHTLVRASTIPSYVFKIFYLIFRLDNCKQFVFIFVFSSCVIGILVCMDFIINRREIVESTFLQPLYSFY